VHSCSRLGTCPTGTTFVHHRMNVSVNGSRSGWTDVHSGVPQKSILGPLLLILYVNNLLEKIRCGTQMFADDTKLWAMVQEVNDQDKLQQELGRMVKTWLLKFNWKKCKVMHVGHNIQTQYQMMNNGKAYTVTKNT